MKRISIFILFTLISGYAWSQATTEPSPFVSKACGFKVKLPAKWRVIAASKKCRFRIISPSHAPDTPVELYLRDGSLNDGADDLGFTKDGGKWMLQGEGSSEAEQIESKNWTGLKGTVPTRVYEKGFYSALGDRDRAVLFDRDHRIAEVTSFAGDMPEFVEGFEFLGRTQPR